MSSGYDKVRDMDDKLAEAKGYERALREVRDKVREMRAMAYAENNNRAWEVLDDLLARFERWLVGQNEVKDE